MISPEMPSRQKLIAVVQCTVISNALKRRIGRPESGSCSLTGSSGAAGGFCCCANAAPATISESHSNRSLIAVPRSAALAVDALVFVLRELALPDRILPARTIALGPLAAAQLRHRRFVVPR